MPESELTEIRKRKNGHIDYIAFDATDIDEAFSEIKSAGFALIEKAPFFLSFWKNRCKCINIIGSDGEHLEFNQIL